MDLCDVSSRELNDGCISVASGVRWDQYFDTRCFGLSERIRQIRHFISGHFPAVGIRKVPVCDEHGELAKLRFKPYSAIGVSRSSDFYARSMRIVGGDSAVRECKKATNELVCLVSGDIDAIFRNRLKCSVGWRSGMPIELRIDAARPLDDRVSPNRVVEGSDEDIRTG